jgi:hypothetical protein
MRRGFPVDAQGRLTGAASAVPRRRRRIIGATPRAVRRSSAGGGAGTAATPPSLAERKSPDSEVKLPPSGRSIEILAVFMLDAAAYTPRVPIAVPLASISTSKL